jgi:polypeptide N-acetylgalactosaminyltransferase
LSPDEKKKFDEGWHNHAFNEYVSDMISLHRSIGDIRHPEYVINNY